MRGAFLDRQALLWDLENSFCRVTGPAETDGTWSLELYPYAFSSHAKPAARQSPV